MSSVLKHRRVVVTGMSIVSPLGNTLKGLWQRAMAGTSGIQLLPNNLQYSAPFPYGGIAQDFQGTIQDFGVLDSGQQKAIRKGLKLMCREIQMGVAVAQLALNDAHLAAGSFDPDRTGVVFGCDHVVAHPEEFIAAYENCSKNGEAFSMASWGTQGLPQITPLWLLKYLPNMPASHITIYNDLRGPNNSITHREASGGIAIAEGAATILRGSADRILVGSTGSSLGPLRSLQSSFLGEIADQVGDPAQACRPFDRGRTGLVFGEGAAALVLEDMATAEARGAPIHAEILGWGTSIVVSSKNVADFHRGLLQAMRGALLRAGHSPEEIGHIHAHGLATRSGDVQEAAAIADLCRDAKHPAPVLASKGLLGNLGAGGGLVELIASILALQHGELYPSVNCDELDPDCPINIAREKGIPAGKNVLKTSYSPYGQSVAVLAGLVNA